MKTFALVALLGLVSIKETSALERHFNHQQFAQQAASSSSSSSSSDEEDVQLGATTTAKYEPTFAPPKDFPAYMSGFGGYKTYMRDTPDRFESEADDTLMRSMYDTYATEGMNADGTPNGRFWVTKANAKKAAGEIVGTHLLLSKKDEDAFVDANFPKAWERYDVNEEGKIELDRMPIFLRHICGNTEACIGM
jgi:hypothetical protein